MKEGRFRLSRRLEAVASLVSRGLVLADVGTDHAHLPIVLCERGIIPSAIAMDVNDGPLGIAAQHIREAGLSDRILVRKSDGLSALRPGEVQCVVIAGMGGGLMARILLDSIELAEGMTELVLQPQSEQERFRAFLEEHRFITEQEEMVLEDGKFYPMMRVRPMSMGEAGAVVKVSDGSDSSDIDGCVSRALVYRYGGLLLQRRHPILHRYLLRERRILEGILAQLKKEGMSRQEHEERIGDLERELTLNGQALGFYAS